MSDFLHTSGTIPDGLGWTHYCPMHLAWIIGAAAFTLVVSLLYRRCDEKQRGTVRKALALALIADELFKVVCLLLGGNYEPAYLPLHLCSINIIFIAVHAWKPGPLLDNFLYGICIPGAVAALLFPTWTKLPPTSFMYWHSFTVHVLLAAYPAVLTAGGDIRPHARYLPRCLLFLLVLAVPIYGCNLLFDTNFMFLMQADDGNPLQLFEQLLGSHLWGFPIIGAAVLSVMYVPVHLWRGRKRKVTV